MVVVWVTVRGTVVVCVKFNSQARCDLLVWLVGGVVAKVATGVAQSIGSGRAVLHYEYYTIGAAG